MPTPAHSDFVVLKFGGTSVSSAANWHNVAKVLRARLADGLQPFVVHSALSGITDRLEGLLAAAVVNEHGAVLTQIEQKHRDLAHDLGVEFPAGVVRDLAELRQIADGIALVHEVSDRIRARVMASGELMATELGAAFLRAQGLDVEWLDARTILHAEDRLGATEKASILSATCEYAPDLELQRRLRVTGRVHISQGFIASDAAGSTVLLGRGGSDTSGAYFAAKLAACRLEIWTDVPGMFSANPRGIPSARLLKALHYDEAQEIASSGAKVLHPRCILPVKQYGIPLYVFATQTPELEGTVISGSPADSDAAQVKAIAIKKGITLISLDSPGMWHQVGFLADAFQIFKQHGLSIDLVSTSETNVTVSLDPAANTLDASAVTAVLTSLSTLCRAQVIGPCAALSLVGRNIRGILHELGDAFALFEEQKIYLVSQAANDLNFTFVIDEDQGDRLVTQLHDLLIRAKAKDQVMGPTWQQLYAPQPQAVAMEPWWSRQRQQLQRLGVEHGAVFVYDGATLDASVAELRQLRAVDRLFYAVKANAFPPLLKRLHARGVAFECVSRGEIERVQTTIPGLPSQQLLFTPNFAPRAEYAWALEQGILLTIDNLYALQAWPELFKGRDVLVRIDPGQGYGHHAHVRTGGVHAKFGVPLFEIDELVRLVAATGANVIGLHAHSGSGVFNVMTWIDTATRLAQVAERFPKVRTLNLGGGLGVPDRSDRPPIDMLALDRALQEFKQAHPRFSLWLEPGRYLVASAGVLLAQVTQLKGKGEVQYVGLTTGMNSLIRPALYGAHHDIVNLSRLEEPSSETYNVVGPICESADFLGHDRRLPPTREGDVILIATAGAYGRAMSSHYNLRDPAIEVLI